MWLEDAGSDGTARNKRTRVGVHVCNTSGGVTDGRHLILYLGELESGIGGVSVTIEVDVCVHNRCTLEHELHCNGQTYVCRLTKAGRPVCWVADEDGGGCRGEGCRGVSEPLLLTTPAG